MPKEIKLVEVHSAQSPMETEPAKLKCRACEGTKFAGPLLYGPVTSDGVFHPAPEDTEYRCLGCHATQPFKDLRPWVSPAGPQ